MREDGETPGEGEDIFKKPRGKSTPKGERADGFDRRMTREFMKMVNGFMVKIGGKEEQEKMKYEFYSIMKEGTEEQK